MRATEGEKGIYRQKCLVYTKANMEDREYTQITSTWNISANTFDMQKEFFGQKEIEKKAGGLGIRNILFAHSYTEPNLWPDQY